MANILTIEEAVAFLTQNTGAEWTSAHILSLAAKCDITLHAQPPASASTIIVEVVDCCFEDRPYSEPGKKLLAELHPHEAKTLWLTGEVSPAVALFEPFVKTNYIFFEEEITITCNDIRILPSALMEILKEWAAAQFGVLPMPRQGTNSPLLQRAQGALTNSAELARLMLPAADSTSQSSGSSGTASKPSIPGKMPNIAIGRIAVEAAWALESEQNGARPTTEQVMLRLQDWASGKRYPETLRPADSGKRGVKWITGKSDEKLYEADTLGKTLSRWWKSRQPIMPHGQ